MHFEINFADFVGIVPVGRLLSCWDGHSGLWECCVSLLEMVEAVGVEYLLMEGPMQVQAV